MKIGNFKEYKGYIGRIEFSADDQCYFGRILNINDLVFYEADSVEDLEVEFHEAVDDYIEFLDMVDKGEV